MSPSETHMPDGSLVLVTGATGHLAAHVVKQLLERGHRVRGTVRDLVQAAWLNEGTFESYHCSGHLELVEVPDMAVKDAFVPAIRGVSGIAHIASILSFSENPHEVITPVVDCLLSILEAASHEPSVKSVVYTSSIAAAVDITPGVSTYQVTRASWNTKAVEVAWSAPPHPPDYWHQVYQASKVQAEQALWDFVKTRNPSFRVNAVSPSTILGEALHRKHLLTPYPWIKNSIEGNREIGTLFQALIHIDVKDAALLHVAALMDPDCHAERLPAWGNYCNINDILAILRRLRPRAAVMDDFDNQTKHVFWTDRDRSRELLNKWGGGGDWAPLEQSVQEALNGVLEYF